MNREEKSASIRDIFSRIVKEHDESLRRLAESEREDRERFEQGLDSKYGMPEDDKDAEDDKADVESDRNDTG
ncbi:MAG: hypothetical protein LC650_02785 [Actinobacteria bacterium]|nr:hypothetical protein [Actinomycetota bacterium]